MTDVSHDVLDVPRTFFVLQNTSPPLDEYITVNSLHEAVSKMVTVDEIKFPWRPVIILAMCMTVNSYTLANLYPYVGVMAKHLLELPTMKEAGELNECLIRSMMYPNVEESNISFSHFLRVRFPAIAAPAALSSSSIQTEN